MSGPPPHSSGDEHTPLELCIRDLVALNALPSMCVGRSPAETLETLLDALPAALSCELLYLEVPGSPPQQYAVLDHAQQSPLLGDKNASIRRKTIPDRSDPWWTSGTCQASSANG